MSCCCPPSQTKGGGPEADTLTPFLWSTDSAGFCLSSPGAVAMRDFRVLCCKLAHHPILPKQRSPEKDGRCTSPRQGVQKAEINFSRRPWFHNLSTRYYRAASPLHLKVTVRENARLSHLLAKEPVKANGCESVHTQFCFPCNMLSIQHTEQLPPLKASYKLCVDTQVSGWGMRGPHLQKWGKSRNLLPRGNSVRHHLRTSPGRLREGTCWVRKKKGLHKWLPSCFFQSHFPYNVFQGQPKHWDGPNCRAIHQGQTMNPLPATPPKQVS